MTNERHEKALEAAEWIEHDGKGMPVDGATTVFVKLRTGWIDWRHTRADYWHDEDPLSSNWVHQNRTPADIVAYLISDTNHFTNGE